MLITHAAPFFGTEVIYIEEGLNFTPLSSMPRDTELKEILK